MVSENTVPLTQGHEGRQVLLLQMALSRKGLTNTRIDGLYDHKTFSAVYSFQEQNGLKPTGVCDHATWVLLEPDWILSGELRFNGRVADIQR